MNLIDRRRQMMMSKSLPYDAEIEYLQGDGHSWIFLPFSINELNYDLVNIYMEVTPTSSSTQIFFGTNASLKQMVLFRNYFRYDWATGDSGRSAIYTINNKYIVKQYNGELFWGENKNAITTKTDSDTKIALFAKTTSQNAVESSTVATVRISYLKIESLSTNTYIFDAIPVRVGQVGYMYDKVSGQLFGNQGTGNFVLGPDKA